MRVFVAEIIAEYVKNYIPEKERCWIAEVDGQKAGSVFVVRKSDEVAKLRMLIVTPEARGLGIGKRLVEECIRFGAAGRLPQNDIVDQQLPAGSAAYLRTFRLPVGGFRAIPRLRAGPGERDLGAGFVNKQQARSFNIPCTGNKAAYSHSSYNPMRKFFLLPLITGGTVLMKAAIYEEFGKPLSIQNLPDPTPGRRRRGHRG